MKKWILEIALAVLLGLGMPLLLFALTDKPRQEARKTVPTDISAAPSRRVTVKLPEGTEEMDLEEYLVGVVLGEMPADFETEALKAQAVVARTFTLRTVGVGKKHPGMVCTDPACCQAYFDPEDYVAQGGEGSDVEKIHRAVAETAGQVLYYDGALIEATYFSCSGGRTEDAQAVWGADVPYLRATDSPGEEGAAHYTDTVTFSASEFAAALGLDGSGDPESWLGPATYTDGGGVETMAVCGRIFKGTELRSLLGLRSTAFTMEASGGEITVVTRGFGHRVGMSQYGAEAMAATGADYASILTHYYQGAELGRYNN